MNEPDCPETTELQIAEVVSHWMESAAVGRPTADQLVKQHPQLAPGLAECLRGLDRLERLTTRNIGSSAEEIEFEVEVEFPIIPDFEVLGELGRGGMGVVYEAKQISLDRIVALKLLPFGAVDQRAVKRFLREAETVASLNHPGIVPVYSVGVHEGLNWYSMQRIDGCPLSQWFAFSTFASRTQELEELVRVGIEAAEALHYAHERGIIHRDVKPGNLLVDTSGKVWLADFGLAKRNVDVTATATGAMLGTPRYMSPEQIADRDDQVDARTDIYSLGATLYEMATGRAPFISESPLDLLTQIQREEPISPRQIDSSVSRALELVILKCLDKEPQRRYPTASALADDLKAIRNDQPISARGLPVWVTASRFFKRYRIQFNAMAMAVLGTLATLITCVLLWQQNEQGKVGSVQINAPANLYVATIAPRANGRVSVSTGNAIVQAPVEPTVVTTPMQQAITMPVGDYIVRLEGIGNVSQSVEMTVKPKALTEIEYVDRRETPAQVDVYSKFAVMLKGNELAVLGNDAFEVFDPPSQTQSNRDNQTLGVESSSESRRRFTLPIAELNAELVETTAENSNKNQSTYSSQDDPPLTFAFDSDQAFQGDFNVSHSGFARIERICTSPIDLNADNSTDYVLTAARHAAMAAVSSNGEILWKRRLPMAFEIAEARSRYSKNGMTNEAIVGITPVDDLNGDGTQDLVVNAALFDPIGFSRPYIFTLSGRDGSQIAVAPLASIDMRTKPTWPWSGLLRHRRQFNSDDRAQRFIFRHLEMLSTRSSQTDLPNDSWGGNSASSALYVLPPLILEKHDDARVAITALDQSIQFINLADGNAASPPITLSQPIFRGPQQVRMADGKNGVLVLTGIPGTALTKCFLELCVLGESQPRWSIPHNVGAYDFVSGAADSSLPMSLDLDGDNVDEILTTTNPNSPFAWPKVNCYSAAGQFQWSSVGIAGISNVVDRVQPVSDIDSDGVADLAIVGLVQRLSQAYATSAMTTEDGLRLYIDFLSGKTGRRIGYRDERVAATLKSTDLAEIDLVTSSGNELVCSVVYGSKEELMLSSVSFTINLKAPHQSVVARGLTSLDWGELSKPNATQKTSHGSWFRRRSGPHSKPADSVVWISKEPRQSSFPSENLAATWTSSDHQPRVLLTARDGTARCLDPISGQVIGQLDRTHSNGEPISVVVGVEGSRDLVFRNMTKPNQPTGFYDAETGHLRFEIEAPKLGAIRSVVVDHLFPNRFVYALANVDSRQSTLLPGRNQGLLLLKIDRLAGQVVWWQNCYEGVEPAQWLNPMGCIQVDINGDSITDLIAGSTNNGRMLVKAIDGRDGRTIWELPLHLDATDWPWNSPWPLIKQVSSGGSNYLLLIDGVDASDTQYEVKSISIQNGRELDSFRHQGRVALKHEVQSRRLSLDVIAPLKRDGMVSLATAYPDDTTQGNTNDAQRTGPEFGCKLLRVDERTGAIKEIGLFDAEYVFFTADIDGDQTLERIEFERPGTIKIRHGDDSGLISKFQIPKNANIRRVEQIASKWYLVLATAVKNEHLWYELPSGTVAFSIGQGLLSTTINHTEYPRILEHAGGALLVGSTPESTLCMETQLASAENATTNTLTPVAMLATETDSRYRKPIRALGVYDRKSVEDVLRLSLLVLGAILLPFGYVHRLLRRRQWSLQVMLMAPAVTMIALVCWRYLLMTQRGYLVPDLLAGLMATLSVWVVSSLISQQQWSRLAIGILLSFIAATLFMLAANASLDVHSLGVVGYWTFNAWLTAACGAAAQAVIPLYAFVRFAQRSHLQASVSR